MIKQITFLILFLLHSITAFSQNEMSIDEKIENWFKPISDKICDIVFYPISIAGNEVPIVLFLLFLEFICTFRPSLSDLSSTN